ncbi:hypothetical protein ASZ90_018777 [hydrocarbon metagenome]|uniref:Uncharacterized protein n=1 Tax=hydrocarbon metagenome TaxID=938273 RepID=A0A0W8E574_9ZZZZ
MIIYIADPMELLQQQEQKKQVRIRLPSGGHLMAESVDFNRWKVVDICSTDPMDYLTQGHYPGSIIGLEDIK